MRKVIVLFTLLISSALLFANPSDETRLLQYSGSAIDEPHWFKDSFLELADDIDEAQEDGKNLLIYFHQAGCPYCFNFVQQSLLDPHLSNYIQQNFDVIALNLWGDREVTLPDGEVLSEKDLALKWKIQYTPTLLFFQKGADPILRIDGYRNKQVFAKVLDYVRTGKTDRSLAQILIEQDVSASLYPSDVLKESENLKKTINDKPTLLLFEYPGCKDCDQLHRQVLTRKDTHSLLKQFNAIRLDLGSEKVITDFTGDQKTARQWAEDLGLSYFPSVVLFDADIKEQLRIDSYVQAFHFNTALEFVSDKIYTRMPEFQRYINERADRLRAQGEKVVITQ